MLETLQEIYKFVSFNNDTNLQIITNKHTISNTASKNINSDVSLQLVQDFKNIKIQMQKKLIIALALNGTLKNESSSIIPTILADNKQTLAQIILDILTHQEAIQMPFQHYIEFFKNQKVILLLESETTNIDINNFKLHNKLWIHIESNNMLEANEHFNKMADKYYEVNKNSQAYFSFIPSSKHRVNILGLSLAR